MWGKHLLWTLQLFFTPGEEPIEKGGNAGQSSGAVGT